MEHIRERQFVCCFHWHGFTYIQLGFHIHLQSPNIEIHLPFCFIRIGWQGVFQPPYKMWKDYTWGWDYRRK